MFEIPNTYYRISVKALIFDNQKRILFAKEENEKWALPGGGIDWGESPQEALAREIQEEMGLIATWIADYPAYFYSDQIDDGRWFAFVLYEAKLPHLNFTQSDECVEIGFFTKEEALALNLFSDVRTFLEGIYNPKRHKKPHDYGSL